jgi:quercetin dioxygenase-like cupin family protein
MRMRSLALLLTTIAFGASPGLAHNVEQVKPVFEHGLPNVNGKRMVAVVVTYPPGAKSPAHHHARSAFIYAYVLSGTIRSQVDDAPPKIYQVGEGFFEMPGSHHRISENASDREPASLLAVFVVDSNDQPLTTPDQTQESQVLRRGGKLISAASMPDQVIAQSHGVEAKFFLVNVTSRRLAQIAELFDRGELRAHVGAVSPLRDASEAHLMLEHLRLKPKGKIVLAVGAS